MCHTVATVRGVLRDDQMALLRWVVAAVGPEATAATVAPLPQLDVDRLRAAGLATGLTAAVGVLAGRLGVELPPPWRPFLTEQVEAVAARRRRYATLTPRVLRALHDAGVAATPVKGAVLADAVWPVPDARPMADIDLIVRPADRERAVRALLDAGLQRSSRTAGEDVLLAWGDGSRGAIDRESAGHNGKVEIHPGWVSEVHHYAIDDGGWLLGQADEGELAGAPSRVLPPAVLTVHALGHLSVCAIRAEVRALNVLDIVLAIAAFDESDGDAFVLACDALDPRLTAPGLRLVQAMRPDWLQPVFDLAALTERQLDRLPSPAAERLRPADPGSMLRDVGARTTVRWRLAFATTGVERAAVLRQALSPRAGELAAAAPGESVWRLQAGRAARAAGRLRARLVARPESRGRVVYVVLADPGGVVPAETFERWPTAGRTLVALRLAGADVVGVARSGAGDELLLRGGVEWHFVRDRSRAAWRIAGRVRRLGPAVVHVNGTGFSLATLLLRLRCGRRARIVVQHHGESPGSRASRLARRVARGLVDAYLFTGGREQAAAFVDAGVLTSATEVHDVLESSADVTVLDRFAARARTGMTGAPAVITVGRLVDGKDPLTVLGAFVVVAERSPAAELWWIFHDGRLEPELRTVLDRHAEVASRVHLVGQVEPSAMGAWLSGADVVLSASRHEGSGYALIEAISCGCTPVVSDIAPHRAIAGSLGTRFPVGDAAAAAEALAAVVLDRDAARERFSSALTWDHVARQLLAAHQPHV